MTSIYAKVCSESLLTTMFCAGDGLTERGQEESDAAEHNAQHKKAKEWDLGKSQDPQQVFFSAYPLSNHRYSSSMQPIASLWQINMT